LVAQHLNHSATAVSTTTTNNNNNNNNRIYIIPLVLPTTGIMPNQLHGSLKFLDLHRGMNIRMQKSKR